MPKTSIFELEIKTYAIISVKNYLNYLRNNPKRYWFKRKLYGWGWVPVKWQGWAVIVIAAAIAWFGAYVGEIDDAPGAFLIGFVLAVGLIILFGYWKGEKPRWQWGLPEEYGESSGKGKKR